MGLFKYLIKRTDVGSVLQARSSPPPVRLMVLCLPVGGRTGEAIVDAALSALRQLVKDRLGGRGGGYSSGKQVRLYNVNF